MNWVDVDVEKIDETEKAVLLDFGADRGCSHQAWVPKKHYFEGVENNFQVQRITRKWVSFKGLWTWI